MLTLYQIEGVRINWPMDGDSHQVSSNINGFTPLGGRGDVVWGRPNSVSLGSKRVEGIIADGEQPYMRTVGLLEALVGQPVELFAFEVLISDNDPCRSYPPVIWLQTSGVIEEVETREEWRSGASVSIRLRHDPIWQPVNRMLWQWRKAPYGIGYQVPVTPAPETLLMSDLVAWWSFEELVGNRRDNTTNAFDLTANATPTTATGTADTAVALNGTTQYLSRANTVALKGSDRNFSVSTHVYLAAKTTDRAIVGKWTEQGNQREYLIRYKSSSDRLEFLVSNNGTAEVSVAAGTFGAPPLNTWLHIVGWHDATNNVIGISVNGLADTTAHSTGVFGGTSISTVGARIDGSGAAATFVSGRIDETSIWNKVLTTGERTYLRNLPYRKLVTDYHYTGQLDQYPHRPPYEFKDLWVKKNYADSLIAYQPMIWEVIHSQLPDGYPQHGYGFYWRSGVQNYVVASSRMLWGAPPLSLYAFKGLTPAGAITIEANIQISAWQTKDVVYTIDLGALNTAMAAYGGIDDEDILILGDYYRPPGFIKRGVQVIDDVVPATGGSVPFGRLATGFSSVSIDPLGGQVAVLHTFRRH